MTPSKYVFLLLTISMIFITHAISPTSSPKLYQNVCNGSQNCLKLIERHPEITLAKDYTSFCHLFIDKVAREHAIKTQNYIVEMRTKYPSSQAIKGCDGVYDHVISQLGTFCIEDPNLMDCHLAIIYDAMSPCESGLADEKTVNVSSIITLNNDMRALCGILYRSVVPHMPPMIDY